MSIASSTSDFGHSTATGPQDEPLRPDLHPKPPAEPMKTAQNIPTAAHIAELAPDEAAAATMVAEVVRDEPMAPAAPVVGPAPHEPADLEPGALDDPLRRGERAPTAGLFPGLAAWLWHARLSLLSGSVSGLVHTVAVVTLGSMLVEPKLPPETSPPLLVSVPVEKFADKIKPPVLKAPEARAPSVRSEGRSTGSGAGSAGTNGGRGGGALGGLQIAPPKLSASLTTGTGGTGFGTDRAYGEDMLGEVGELKTEATFFGVKAQGRSFVFVVDTSGSMAQNNRYLRCRAELLRAVNELGHGQKYFIAFFNHQTFAMPERKLVDARSPQIKKTTEWIVHAMPAGSTEPWDAFQMALRLKPDAVFLLTDGEFSPDVARRILNAQNEAKKKIPVHTIAFESIVGEPALKAIADATGGKYLYVP